MDPYRIQERDAEQIRTWIETRGGVNVWDSVNLSDPGMRWLTPVKKENGSWNLQKPHWGAGQIIRILTTLDEVEVITLQLVKRFHVAVRMGSQGMALKVTEGGSRRIRAECAKAGEDSWHEFVYGDYENALIFKPRAVVPLREWRANATA